MDLPTTPNSVFDVWIKANAQQTSYQGYHEHREVFEFRISAVATQNNANKELLYFLKKEFGLSCSILSGQTSKQKTIRVDDYSSSSS